MNRPRPIYRIVIGSILPIILTLSAIFSASAADSDGIIKKIQKSFEKHKNLQADYTVEYINDGAADTYIEIGHLVWAGENRFRTDTPEQTIVCDGTTLWMFSAGNGQVIVRNVADGMNDLITPQKLLYEYPAYYEVQKVESVELMGKSCFLLTMKPISDTDPTKSLQVWVDKSNYVTLKFKLVDLADNQTVFTLTNVKFDSDLPDDIFTYDPPKGVEIIDVR